MKYKVSVVLPVYNVENYIDDCLNSLINQSFDDFEVVAINDGSTDNSLEKLNKYLNKDINLKIISQENGGLSKARNTGIRNSSGEYILFLDSDDMLDETCIEKLYLKAKSNDLDLVIFDPLRFNDDTKVFETKDSREKSIYNQDIMDIGVYLKKAQKQCLLMSTLHFYKASIIKDNEIFFEEGILHEDELHSLTAYNFINKIGYVNEKLYIRRFREGSIMTNNIYSNKNSLESYIYILNIFSKYKNQNISEELKKLIDIRSTLILSNLIRYDGVNLKKLMDIKKKMNININSARVLANIVIFKFINRIKVVV